MSHTGTVVITVAQNYKVCIHMANVVYKAEGLLERLFRCSVFGPADIVKTPWCGN
jgi:hypothetical protein